MSPLAQALRAAFNNQELHCMAGAIDPWTSEEEHFEALHGALLEATKNIDTGEAAGRIGSSFRADGPAGGAYATVAGERSTVEGQDATEAPGGSERVDVSVVLLQNARMRQRAVEAEQVASDRATHIERLTLELTGLLAERDQLADQVDRQRGERAQVAEQVAVRDGWAEEVTRWHGIKPEGDDDRYAAIAKHINALTHDREKLKGTEAVLEGRSRDLEAMTHARNGLLAALAELREERDGLGVQQARDFDRAEAAERERDQLAGVVRRYRRVVQAVQTVHRAGGRLNEAIVDALAELDADAGTEPLAVTAEDFARRYHEACIRHGEDEIMDVPWTDVPAGIQAAVTRAANEMLTWLLDSSGSVEQPARGFTGELGELGRLSDGLRARDIKLIHDGLAEGALVDTALAELDRRKNLAGGYLEWRDHTAAVLDGVRKAITTAADAATAVLNIEPDKTYHGLKAVYGGAGCDDEGQAH